MIVLDTHAWLYLVGKSDQLSDVASRAIEQASSLAVSSISVWEAAHLAARKRVEFAVPTPALTHLALHADDRIRQIPFDSEMALRTIEIMERGLTGDPADQMILATAESLGVKLVTADRRLREFAPSQTIW